MRNWTNWFSSLQFRLILAFAVILALALGSVSYYVGQAAAKEAQRFEIRREEVRRARVEKLVAGSYHGGGQWIGLQPILERAGSLSGRRIVVRNTQGEIVGDSHLRLGTQGVDPQTGTRYSLLFVGGQEVGSFMVAPHNVPGLVREPPISRLVGTVNRYLLWTGLAAGLVGILAISVLSRRLLAPIQALAAAAARLGGGDLSQRVSTSGPSEIATLARSFNAMAGSLQQAEEQRRNLAVDVAHELRTPLSNIQGYLEAVKDGLLEADSSTIDIIYQQALHLSSLVEDLRLLAQVEGGSLRLDLEPSSLEALLTRSVEAFRARAGAKGVQLSLQVAEAIPQVVMDGTRIAQVVGNLLENAIQHTDEGGRVHVFAEAIDGATARVTVEDSGAGIAPEDLPQLFDRFYRVDPSRSRATGGVGLGLTIAKQLVEAHGGAISAESTPNVGSRFTFELPVIIPTDKITTATKRG